MARPSEPSSPSSPGGSAPPADAVGGTLEAPFAADLAGIHTAPQAPDKRLVEDPGIENRVLIFEPKLLQRILALGLPVIVGMLTQTAINQVDTIFVGHLDEKTAVAGTAALGFSLVLLWAFGGFLSAIAIGTQAMTARRIGAQDPLGAGSVLTNALAIAVGSSIIVTALAIALTPTIFGLLHKDPDVQALGVAFCRVRFLGILPMVVTAALKAFYDGKGKVRVHMTVAIVMNVVNLALCYVFVFGRFGVPALGFVGTAWAAVIAAATGMVLMLAWALRKGDRRQFRAFRLANLNAGIARGVARLSVFSGLATLFVMTGFGMFFAIVGKVDEREGLAGVNASAAQLVISVTMLVFMTCIAFGTSTATLVSQSMGAKKPDLAARYGWQSVFVIVILMSAVGALLYLFPETVLRVFLPHEAGRDELLKDAVIAVATSSLRFCGFIAPIAAAALVLTQALYGAGESRFVAIAEGTLHFTCLVPLAYLFAIRLDLGLIGCWYATAIYGLALLVATAVKFASGSWQKTVI